VKAFRIVWLGYALPANPEVPHARV
jgi:hypothetical protein